MILTEFSDTLTIVIRQLEVRTRLVFRTSLCKYRKIKLNKESCLCNKQLRSNLMEKLEIGARKLRNWWEMRENLQAVFTEGCEKGESTGRAFVQPLAGAGKLVTGAKQSVGKLVTGAKRRKTWNCHQVRQKQCQMEMPLNIKLMPSTEKQLACAKRGERQMKRWRRGRDTKQWYVN